MRCDLHVHTRHSGMCNIPVASSICRECYNEPSAVYERLKRLGMDLVTVTDHDSIDAVEHLRTHPDFFLSEEVTCHLPSGTEIHVGVYDIDDSQHIELQKRRHDFEAFIAYAREQKLFYTLNHVLSGLTGRRANQDFEYFERSFPGMETRNGAMLAVANEGAARMAQWLKLAEVGGSDAHSMASVGTAWTEVPGARDKREFIDGLHAARSVAHGESGNYLKLTRDVLEICHNMVAEHAWTAALLPLIWVGVPTAIAVNYWLEQSFARRWMGRVSPAGLGSAQIAGEVA
jgi:predicted metal-dependent phosphoesterase TrpH